MSDSKHVVLLKSRSGNCGGLEKYASRIASAFAEQGSRVSILSTQSSKNYSASPLISFYSIKTSPWPSFLRMEQFDRFVHNWLQGKKVDLVFGMDRNRFQTHIRAGNGVHLSYLKSRILTEGKWKHWTCLCNPMHRKILSLEKAAFENPRLEKLFANSYMVRDEILKYYSIQPNKIEVIHNGVEWHEMEQAFAQRDIKRIEIAKKFHLDSDLFHFLFIGNGYLRKGLDRLLEALARLKTKEFHLSVVGKDKHIEFYQSKAVLLGLKDKVRFFGSQEEIRPFYQLADALVIPSFYDPFANVTIEALAMGLFVISSKHNGGHEIINAQNGLVIENLLDVDSLADSLTRALKYKKTKERALLTRQSVAHLDFSSQLTRLIQSCGNGHG